MGVLSGRAVRTALAIVCAASVGVLAIYAAEPLGDALRWVLDFFDPDDVAIWCLVLAGAGAVLWAARGERHVRTIRARAASWRAPLRRAGTVRAGIALPFVVAAAFAVRVALDRSATIPRVFGDELIYSGLAKALASGSGLDLRGVHVGLGYGPLYPLLLSTVYRFAADGAQAFWSVQTLNALLLALSAVPAYYLARRIVSHGWSLVVATLSVAVPAMAYSALVMTEALFYPGFVATCLVLVLTLERPTHARQAMLVGSIAALATVRVQALVFVPAFLTAIVIESLRAHTGPRVAVRRFGTALALLAVGGLVALAAYGGDVRGPLGAYGALVRGYSIWGTVEWLAWNVAVLDVSLGFVAFGAFLVAMTLLLRRSSGDREAAFAAAAAGITVWTAMAVALLSASPYGLDHIHWRSISMVVPVILTGAVWWLASGRPRPPLPTLAAAAATLVLPLLVPWRLVIHLHSVDTPATLVWQALDGLGPLPSATAAILPFAILGVAAILLARTATPLLASIVLAFAAVWAAADFDAGLPREQAARFAWVDRALPDGERAVLLHVNVPESDCPWIASGSRQRDLEVMTEFFNTSVTTVRNIWGQIIHDGLASRQITFGADGSLRDEGRTVPVTYLVADSRLGFAGERLARLDMREIEGPWAPRPTGSLTLWRVEEPARLADPLQIREDRLARLSCQPPDTIPAPTS